MVAFSKAVHYPKLPTGVLPPEVITRIMQFYMQQTDFKTTNDINSAEDRLLIISTTMSLQRLRLIARNWAEVVPYFLFDVVRLQTPGMARRLLGNWQGSILSSPKSPLRVLSMEDLWCYNPADANVFIPETVQGWVSRSIPMDVGAKVIMTFGINITSLNLIFGDCMMVSCDMIEAVKNINSLKKLTLIRRYDWPRRLGTHSASIGQLLYVSPYLESLSISLPYLESHFLLPGSLPSLKHLWFKYYSTSREALTQISRAANRTLKTIEYNSDDPTIDRPSGILEASRNNLECLCIDTIPTNLPPGISFTTFPNLRCIRTTSWPLIDFDLDWLQQDIFRSIRTLVTKYSCGNVYWLHALRLLRDEIFPRPKNFKHIIFTSCQGSNLVDDELVVAFDKYDIKCHFMSVLEYEKILELDFMLNGPMESLLEE